MIGTLRHSILGVNPAPPAICKPWQWQDQHTASTYAGSNSMRSCMKLDNSTYISGQKVAEEGKSSISAKTWIGEIVQFGLVYAIYIYTPFEMPGKLTIKQYGRPFHLLDSNPPFSSR